MSEHEDDSTKELEVFSTIGNNGGVAGDGDGVRGSPASDKGGLSITSGGEVFIIGTVSIHFVLSLRRSLKLLDRPVVDPDPVTTISSWDDDDEDERNVRVSLLLPCVIPESGDVLQLTDGAVSFSIERRVLSNSVEANATNLSKPELIRSCQCDSSSGRSSIEIWNPKYWKIKCITKIRYLIKRALLV